jgi:Uma2 family endonuclease
MAEPAWKPHRRESEEPDDGEDHVTVQRVVEHPDGRLELVELPLTLELYLDPQLGDKMSQGDAHARLMRELGEMLSGHFEARQDVKVFTDLKHRFYRGFGPGPDVSVVQGIRHPQPDYLSFDAATESVIPSLVIEIVSPQDSRVRKMDEKDKFAGYEKVGIPEYLLLYPPGRRTGPLFLLKGFRLGPKKRYQPIEPDAQGRLLSETTGLLFGASPDGKWVEVFDAATGERILTPSEDRKARQAAEQRAMREAEARRVAEEELARLRAEVERLKRR